MREQTVEAWLIDVASDAPAPGGGAAAAMNAALARADTLRQEALSLAGQDVGTNPTADGDVGPVTTMPLMRHTVLAAASGRSGR